MTQDNGFSVDNLDVFAEAATFKVGVIQDNEGNDKSGFVIVGKNSPEYQTETRRIRAEGLKRASKRKTALDTSTDEGSAALAALIDANEIVLACCVVVGWFGFATAGQPAPFDKAIATKLLTRFPTWRDKISAALEDDANFMKG